MSLYDLSDNLTTIPIFNIADTLFINSNNSSESDNSINSSSSNMSNINFIPMHQNYIHQINTPLLVSNVLGNINEINIETFINYDYQELSSDLSSMEEGEALPLFKKSFKIKTKLNIFIFSFSNMGKKVNKIII